MRVAATVESWPIARPFTIARGTKTTADVVVATIVDGRRQGRGECVPYARYGESVAAVAAAVDGFSGPFDRLLLQRAMPPGAARNAIDCALWDLEAKRTGQPAWKLAGLPRPAPVATAYTLSLDAPAAMAEQACRSRHRPLLKVKLGSTDVGADVERLRAVRANAPAARLIVDANEGWSFSALARFMPAAAASGVELIEQPLPAAADSDLDGYRPAVPIGADESLRDGENLAALARRYQAVNVKLDKTGGLTRALDLVREARALGVDIMVGCMVSTSLAIAPALLLAGHARFVDLDGPQLLADDRQPGLDYNGDRVSYDGGVWG